MARERYPRYASHRDGMWVVLPLGEHWDSYVRFDAQAGHPVIAELRILPRTDTPGVLGPHDPHADDWLTATLGGTPEVAPPEDGLTTRALRRVHLGHALELAYEQLDQWIDRERRQPDWQRPVPAFTDDAISAPRRPGRKGRDDRFYATVASAYVDALERGSRKPVVDAAQSLGDKTGGSYEPTYIRDLLHEARRRELLTRPPKGRAGGQLTEKAFMALRDEGEE